MAMRQETNHEGLADSQVSETYTGLQISRFDLRGDQHGHLLGLQEQIAIYSRYHSAELRVS